MHSLRNGFAINEFDGSRLLCRQQNTLLRWMETVDESQALPWREPVQRRKQIIQEFYVSHL